jgi:dienelactone hydrolase
LVGEVLQQPAGDPRGDGRAACDDAADRGEQPLGLGVLEEEAGGSGPETGGTRTLGTALVEELASRGYLVATVDHTYEADQVEFPGGRVERAVPLPEKLTKKVIADLLAKHARIRLTDMAFVLDRLAELARGRNPDADGRHLPAGLRGALNMHKIGVLGQSLGGTIAAQLAHDDSRIAAAVNLDGEFLGRVAKTGVTKPFLIMASNSHTLDSKESNWRTFWDESTGWKRALRLRKSEHGSFTDLQAVFPQLAGRLKGFEADDLIGTIDPHRSVAAQRSCVSAFFGLHLKGEPTRLLDHPSRRYPELERLS